MARKTFEMPRPYLGHTPSFAQTVSGTHPVLCPDHIRDTPRPLPRPYQGHTPSFAQTMSGTHPVLCPDHIQDTPRPLPRTYPGHSPSFAQTVFGTHPILCQLLLQLLYIAIFFSILLLFTQLRVHNIPTSVYMVLQSMDIAFVP